MDKKDILIVAIIAIVASLAVSSFAPQVGLSPGISNVADACNGDKLCEMYDAKIDGDLTIGGEVIGGMENTNAETICGPQRFLDGNGDCKTTNEIFHSGGALGGVSLTLEAGDAYDSVELPSDLCFSGGMKHFSYPQQGISIVECKVDCGGIGNCNLIARNQGDGYGELICYATCFL